MINELLEWYDANKRDLPWRETKDPYRIWVSEIILQQTRVDQGMPYYHRFLEAFPMVADLAKADQDSVLKMWEGLGYYSRARNMHETAKRIIDEFGGEFPSEFDVIRSMKGIGDYTAAAIGSISFGIPKAAVDGNVLRVVSRTTGSKKSIDEQKTRKEITAFLDELIPKNKPSEFNQAMMELGARICTPKNWSCDDCPISSGCIALDKSLQSELPVRTKKVKKRVRYFVYLVHEKNGETEIRKRGKGDVWEGLWEFPLVEVTSKEFQDATKTMAEFSRPGSPVELSEPFKHILTHQTIHAVFGKGNLKLSKMNVQTVKWSDLSQFAFPKLVLNYLNTMF